jgi:GNAT superfamily N-acetyltransferase
MFPGQSPPDPVIPPPGSPNGVAVLRRGTADDADSLARLSQELGYPVDAEAMRVRLKTIVGRPEHLLLVAELPHSGVCGWLHAFAINVVESGFRVEIAGLVVANAARRRGVGRLLVDAAECWARTTGAESIIVRSNVKRTESHAFYPALGYTVSKTQTVFRKRLAAG